MKRQLGFTLIELVIVIVILGILAVIAAPKFMKIQSDARKADLQQLAATLKSSIATVNAKAMIEGKETALASTVDGISIANGYPIASNMGIVKTLQASQSWYIANPTVAHHDVNITLFSLYSIKDLDASKALATGCYVMYSYYPTVDEKPSMDNKGSKGKQSWKDWWNESPQAKIAQAKITAMKYIICPILNFKSIDIAKTLPICPQYLKPKGSKIINRAILLPIIRIVDNKC